MTYWIIESIQGQGVFITVDSRTTADFQQGMGKVYCDGATKLFTFNNAQNKKKGAICIAGTAIRLDTNYTPCAIQRIMSLFISSRHLKTLLSSPTSLNAENIFEELLAFCEKAPTSLIFAGDNGRTLTIKDIILEECAIGICLIDSNNVSMYGYGIIVDSLRTCSRLHINENVLIASNNKYESYSYNNSPVIPQRILNKHKKIIDSAKYYDFELLYSVSDTYDQSYCLLQGQFQDHNRTIKVQNILDETNYISVNTLMYNEEISRLSSIQI